jgi:hypothetical protein
MINRELTAKEEKLYWRIFKGYVATIVGYIVFFIFLSK